jgi:hypothetical protein
MSNNGARDNPGVSKTTINRRSMLLAGPTLAAASAIGSGSSIRVA